MEVGVGLVLRLAAPLLPVGIFCLLDDALVPARQQQGIGVAYFSLDQAEVTGRIKQAGVPTFPVGEKLFDFVSQAHRPNVTETTRPDNRLCLTLRAY